MSSLSYKPTQNLLRSCISPGLISGSLHSRPQSPFVPPPVKRNERALGTTIGSLLLKFAVGLAFPTCPTPFPNSQSPVPFLLRKHKLTSPDKAVYYTSAYVMASRPLHSLNPQLLHRCRHEHRKLSSFALLKRLQKTFAKCSKRG